MNGKTIAGIILPFSIGAPFDYYVYEPSST